MIRLALAPMQDVTDLAFMRTLLRIGSLPDLFITAYFRSTRTTCAMAEANLRCIQENETGVPILAQLAGSEAAALCRDAEALLQLPVAGINLNAGCPSPLVNRHGAGAGLLREPEHFLEIMQALRGVVPAGLFSVKCRLGWAEADEFTDLLPLLAAGGADEVMVHARTRRQLYGGEPQRDYVTRAVQSLPCPVWGNGDIITMDDAAAWVREAGVAGLLIGRGAVRNPYIFRMLRGGNAPTREEMLHYYMVLTEETDRILHTKRTPAGHCNRMKKYLAFCYPDFSREDEYALRRCKDIDDMRRIFERHAAR
ncbi:MAG: tRNA-dihydrouridine synthase family protein [Akkermansia sp.]|nr:tRNA-dihydrouridine synthase family protein [Akkermansia sp.]